MADTQPYGNGRGRPKDEPTISAGRKIWLLLSLLRDGSITAADYKRRYESNDRTLQRDLKQLRTIGEELGFSISTLQDGRASLTHFDRKPRRFADERDGLLRLVAEVARAFGPPVSAQLDGLASRAPDGASFIHVHMPALVAGSRVAEICEALYNATYGPAGRCMVRFRYRSAGAKTAERLVEPDHVVVRAGRYYLVAYDRDRSAWRIFALDAMEGLPARAGSITTTRQVPANYLSADVLGFFKGAGELTAVTVELRPGIAASVASRVWQEHQRVEQLANGAARITVDVPDVTEVVRWALGFAPDARIVAPPAAVRIARELAASIAAEHPPAAERLSAPKAPRAARSAASR